MKKAVCLVLLSLISVVSLEAKLPLLSEEKSQKIEDLACSVYDFFEVEAMGYEPVSEVNERFIREIFDLSGIKRKVVIRSMSNSFMQAGARRNAMVLDRGLVIYTLVNEEFFNTLPQDEQEFLIAHEAAHALKLHIPKKAISAVSLAMLTAYLDVKFFGAKLSKTLTVPLPYAVKNMVIPQVNVNQSIALPLITVIGLGLNAIVSKLTEFDADINAGKLLKTCKGGKLFFERYDGLLSDKESRFRVKRLTKRLLGAIGSVFSTHPTFENRIALLEKLEEDPQASLPTLLVRLYADHFKDLYRNFSGHMKAAIA